MHLSLVRAIIKRALDEDIGKGDITSEAIASPSIRRKARIIAKEEGILAGIEIVKEVFRLLCSRAKFTDFFKDGDYFKEKDCLLTVEADSLSLLMGERVALNFLQRLSGIATLTRKYVDLTAPYGIKILDTRKTTPNLRLLEKYAVKVGGGFNHRLGLDNGILIKDNHIKVSGGIEKAVKKVRQSVSPIIKIEVEVKSLDQIEEAIKAGVDIIMLDNFKEEGLKEAVEKIKKEAKNTLVEVSGRVELNKLVEIAKIGVDLISVGKLTHSAKSLDMSFEIE